jgi:hypothetical protein
MLCATRSSSPSAGRIEVEVRPTLYCSAVARRFSMDGAVDLAIDEIGHLSKADLMKLIRQIFHDVGDATVTAFN